MVADRLVCEDGGRVGSAKKIGLTKDRWAVACTGGLVLGFAFQDWLSKKTFKSVRWKDSPLASKEDTTTEAIFLSPDGDVFYHEGAFLCKAEAPFFAIGSGSKYALGAMAHGATAFEAARVACELDCSCGNGFDIFEAGSSSTYRDLTVWEK